MKHSIEIYERVNGEIPFYDFLRTLNPKDEAKILRDLDLLESYGNSLREPYTKCLRDGLFELRTKFGSNAYRSIYYFVYGRIIVITHCFSKKQNKTPDNEIETALKYKTDWEERRNEIQSAKEGITK